MSTIAYGKLYLADFIFAVDSAEMIFVLPSPFVRGTAQPTLLRFSQERRCRKKAVLFSNKRSKPSPAGLANQISCRSGGWPVRQAMRRSSFSVLSFLRTFKVEICVSLRG